MKRIALALLFVCAFTLSAYAQETAKEQSKKDAKAQSAPTPPEQVALDNDQYKEIVRVYTAVSAAETARNQSWINIINVDLKDALKVVAVAGEAKEAAKEVDRATLERELVLDQIRKAKNCDGCGLSQDGKFLLRPAQAPK